MNEGQGEFAPWLGVFETLRVVEGVPLFLAEHRAELGRALDTLGLQTDFDFEQACHELPRLSGRWRWIVSREEMRTLFIEEAEPSLEPIALAISPVRVGSFNWDARFKTLGYLSHYQAWKTGASPEVILLNEHGNVASGARGNLFWRQDDLIFTPAHEAGCRCGVVREFVLKHQKVVVGHYPVSDLLQADEIFVTSSMKGIISINERQGCPLTNFSSANRLREIYAQEIAAQARR